MWPIWIWQTWGSFVITAQSALLWLTVTGQPMGTTFVCFRVCFVTWNSMFKITFHVRNQQLQNLCTFKTCMGFLRPILVKLEMSCTQQFLHSTDRELPFYVSWGVVNANNESASILPLNHVLQFKRTVSFAGHLNSVIKFCMYICYA